MNGQQSKYSAMVDDTGELFDELDKSNEIWPIIAPKSAISGQEMLDVQEAHHGILKLVTEEENEKRLSPSRFVSCYAF